MGRFWAVWKESLIPLAGGAVYGAIVGYAKQSSLDGVSAGGVAFFCLLAVQGQILRGAANARDDLPVPETGDDFVSIRSGIEELKEQGALQEVGPEKPEDGQKALFRNLAQTPAKRAPVQALAPRQLLDLKMPGKSGLELSRRCSRSIPRRRSWC